jgi:hypothetical protein
MLIQAQDEDPWRYAGRIPQSAVPCVAATADILADTYLIQAALEIV